MKVAFPNLIREKIQKIIDEIALLSAKKKALVLEYIKPLDDEIELLKTKILSEWKLDKTEKQFHGTAPVATGEDVPHATISQAVKIEINYKQIITDFIAEPDNIQAMAVALKMTEEEFNTRYTKRTESKPSVRIYT